jgi:lysophospholipase L1-like esterase
VYNKKQATVLIFTNILTLVFLLIVSFHYNVPQKILAKLGIIENSNIIAYSQYDIRNALFSEYYNKEYRIVMLGDSITQGVEWNELLGITQIANRGIGSDTTEGFIKRLSDIYKLQPEICFIMGGINDLGRGISVKIILQNMEKIIDELERNKIKPIIQSTLYVSKGHKGWEKTNTDVDGLNNGLKNICMENGLTFIDVNKILSADGALINEYTYDGVHLFGIGYKKWGELIIPIIKDN